MSLIGVHLPYANLIGVISVYLLGVIGAISVHLLSVIGVVGQLVLSPEVAPEAEIAAKAAPLKHPAGNTPMLLVRSRARARLFVVV